MGIQYCRVLVDKIISGFSKVKILNKRLTLPEIKSNRLKIGDPVVIINVNGAADFKREISCNGYVISKDLTNIKVFIYAPINDTFVLNYRSYGLGWELKKRR